MAQPPVLTQHDENTDIKWDWKASKDDSLLVITVLVFIVLVILPEVVSVVVFVYSLARVPADCS